MPKSTPPFRVSAPTPPNQRSRETHFGWLGTCAIVFGVQLFLQQAIQKHLQDGLWREGSRDLSQAASFNKNQQIKSIKNSR